MDGVTLKQGDVIYKYQLQSKLGGGEFGDVWLAYDNSVANLTAVKLMDSKKVKIIERLIEARIGNRLNHPNLVKVHYADVATFNGVEIVIIAMDYLPGGPITNRLNSGNFLPIPQVIQCTTGVLRGLEYLHGLNMIHNDVKPSNILIGSNGESLLTDYGITCYSPDSQPVPHRGFYMLHVAPETLLNNNVSFQTDIYQTGLTAFRLMNGLGLVQNRRDQVGTWNEYFEIVKKGVVSEQRDYLAFIPRNLKAVINKAIDPDPSRRYLSALDFRRALERINYPGYWTIDPTGRYLGEDSTNNYLFELDPRGHQKSDFTALKVSKKTGRSTRITRFCGKNLSDKDLSSIKTAFMQSVVSGIMD